MDEITIRQLAKETVARFLDVDWENTPEAQVVEQGGKHILIITPNMKVPYASLHINLEMQVEGWIRDYLLPMLANLPDADAYDDTVKYYAGRDHFEAFLRQIASNAPDLLFDFLRLLNIVKARAHSEAAFGVLSETLQAKCIKEADEHIQDMLERYGLEKNTRRGAPSTINTNEMLTVIQKSDRARLSQNRLAKELKTTPAVIRGWLRKRGYKSLADLVADLDRHVHQTVSPNRKVRKH